MNHIIWKRTNIEFEGWVRNIKYGFTFLPYLCLDKNPCSRYWQINFGLLVFGGSVTFINDRK